VIIQTRSAAARAALKQALLAHGDVIEAEHPSLNALTVKLHGDDLGALDLDPTVTTISSDAEVTVTGALKLTKTAAQRKGGRESGKSSAFNDRALLPPTLRQTLGVDTLPYTGEGIGIAIVDSGIYPNRDLSDNIAGFWDFTKGGVPAYPYDDYGHGTHVAGLIASSGELSNNEFRGVAPDVRLYGFKVLDKNGRGKSSDVLKALDFIIANHAALRIDVINMSLGHAILEPAATDPLVQAVQRAVKSGLVVMVAAGNVGVGSTGTIGYAGILSPGNAPSAVTVGATDTRDTAAHGDDRVAWFSSRGPTWFDGFAKPDIVAPGVGLISDVPLRGTLAGAYPQIITTAKGGVKRFAVLSGTSMATAVATGIAALVLQAERAEHCESLGSRPLAPNMTKAMLQFSALPVLDDSGNEVETLAQGTGEINAGGSTLLARAYDTATRHWARYISPATAIGGSIEAWSQELIWGTKLVSRPSLTSPTESAVIYSPAFDAEVDNIVWGTSLADNDNIVWGTAAADGENIVWGTMADVDNIVWGTNIVWATNIVWGDRIVGAMSADGTKIVWGTVASSDGENIVWGTMRADSENIVWGTMAADGENIVWGTSLRSDAENIVWGTVAGPDTDNIVWGTMLNKGVR
jgi:serine protease AprX